MSEGLPIYLDHNASTPLDPAVFDAMTPYYLKLYGNPSSIDHVHGHLAAQAVENAREQIATVIGARAPEIIFTGSCTEANNLAILGLVSEEPSKRHVITSRIEHPSIIEPARELEQRGWRVTWLDVDQTGRVDPAAVASAIAEDTALVSVMGANNEVGTVQPLAEIGAICADHGVLFHSDLAQSALDQAIDVEALGLHLASFSAHKAYGPKGVGALYVRGRRPRPRVRPILLGGGQERGLRSGTLNTPAIVGMGEAFRLAAALRAQERPRVAQLRDMLLNQLTSSIDGVQLNGSPDHRLANNLSVSIDRIEPLAVMRRIRDIASVSASSACATGKFETSHVLIAMFGDCSRARAALRISMGRFTRELDVASAGKAIIDAVNGLRRLAA